jgi:hypothetical protein
MKITKIKFSGLSERLEHRSNTLRTHLEHALPQKRLEKARFVMIHQQTEYNIRLNKMEDAENPEQSRRK